MYNEFEYEYPADYGFELDPMLFIIPNVLTDLRLEFLDLVRQVKVEAIENYFKNNDENVIFSYVEQIVELIELINSLPYKAIKPNKRKRMLSILKEAKVILS